MSASERKNPIIDLYFQVGTDVWLSQSRPALAHRSGLDDLARAARDFQAMGYDLVGAGLVPFPSAEGTYDEANDGVLAATISSASDVDSIARKPFYAVVPCDGHSPAWLRARLASGAPCLGIKLWPYMGRFSLETLASDRELLDLVLEQRLVVSVHVGTGREYRSRAAFARVAADPSTAIDVAAALPEVTFIVAHLARLSTTALERLGTLSNVYIDTSGLSTLGSWKEDGRDVLPADDAGDLATLRAPEILTRIALDYGVADRMIFGSNWPFCTWWGSSPTSEAKIVLESELSDSQKRAILHDNAVRLCGSRRTSSALGAS